VRKQLGLRLLDNDLPWSHRPSRRPPLQVSTPISYQLVYTPPILHTPLLFAPFALPSLERGSELRHPGVILWRMGEENDKIVLRDYVIESIKAEIESEYLTLVRKTFREWDSADTEEKRRFPD
jgi:hypothetical protein